MSYKLLIEDLQELKVDQKFIGVPYLAGGTTLEGTDCAGEVWLFLRENDIASPVVTDDYQVIIKEFIRRGQIISNKNELKPLDIILFKINNEVYHAGVYVGYGKFLQQNANTKSGIGRLSSLWGNYFYYGIRPTELYYNNEELYNEIKDKRIEFVVTAIAIGVAAIITGAATAIAATAAGGFFAGLAFNFIVAVVTIGLYAGISYGISALASSLMPKPNFGTGGVAEGSPRYSFGLLQNTATSDLPIPILYGELKLAGNAVYQSDPGETVYRCDVLCEGEVNSISNIRVNDTPIGDLEGCSVTTYLGTASQVVDSRFSNRVPGLRNVAYLALTLKTSDKLKGGFPVVTYIVQGTKIETWTGINWATAKTYSNNPAACVRDFLTNIRYGIGLPKSLLDEESFGEVYDYCNILVDDNAGGTEARYTLNYIIDAKKPAVDILSELLITCSSFLVWSGNKVKLRTEKVENTVQNFNMSNIVGGSFSYQYVSKDTMINRVKLLYIDPTQNYTKVFALAEDKTGQDERSVIEGGNGIVEREVALLGVTKFSRASRLANMFLKISKATPLTCTFKAGIYAIHCEPGDVVSVSHDVPNWTNKLFRVFSIEEEPNDEVNIICKEYNDSVYDDSYGSSITTYQYGTAPNYLKNTSEVTSIVLSEVGWRNQDGTHIANIDVSWTAPAAKDYLTGYYIEWNKNGAGYVFTARADIGSTSVIIPNAQVGNSYGIRVKTVNYYGIFSSGVTSNSILMVGKDENPPDVENFIVNQFRDSIVFTWDKITSIPDIHHYEIKQGSTWNSGTIIGSLLAGNNFTYSNIQDRTYTYWIKAVDNSGNYSTNATYAQVKIENIPFQNILVEKDEHPAWTGMKNHLFIGVGGTYNASNNQYSDSSLLYNGEYFGSGNLLVSPGYLSGDYLLDWIDVGQKVTTKVGFDSTTIVSGDLKWDSNLTTTFDTYESLKFSGFDISGNSQYFIQTSGDSGASGDWVAWQYADYIFKAVRTKVVLLREDINQNITLSALTTKIDVPDVDEYGPSNNTYRFCPSTGDNVVFTKVFYKAPNVAIMVYPSGGIIRTPEVSASTASFSLTLRDKDNVAVAGNYRYHVHGFVWLICFLLTNLIMVII